MKTTKNFLAIILAILMVISIIPITASAEKPTSGPCGDNLTWTFDESTGTLTISGEGAMYDYANSYAVPWHAHINSMESVVISQGVTTVGDSAFYNHKNIKNVSIADSVTIIDEQAFYNCTGLTDVVIGKGVTTIGDKAFYECSNLKTVTIYNAVKKIGKYSFPYSSKLTDVYYLGTEAEWNSITKATILSKTGLENATIHFLGEETHECSYNAIVTAPTCTEQGYTTYTCECGDSYVDDYVDALGHTEEIVPAVAPTCTETGLTEGAKCSVCDEILTEQEIMPANGHTPANTVEENYVAPTCTENGSKDVVVYCSICEDEICRESVVIETKGHEDADNDGYCDNCDEQICNHRCHKSGIAGFIWKIFRFVNRIFGINKICDCGVAHY